MTPAGRDASGNRVAIVLPGVRYTPARPLLHFAAATLRGRGWTVVEVWWEPPTPLDDPVEWVRSELERRLPSDPGGSPLLIAKSLGTLALPVAAERGLPGVWLTPLVHERTVTDALARQRAPTLVIAGGADRSWDDSASSIGNHRSVVLEHADHALEVPGDVRRSLAHLATVVDEVGRFVDGLG